MPFVALFMLLVAIQPGQVRESATCETNIVSATVVATYCSHRSGDDDIIDLMILWRGSAGWFQRRTTGRFASGGSHTVGGGSAGHVTEHRLYGDVEIRYNADFDSGIVTIGNVAPIALHKVNAVLVDGVDRPEGGRVQRTLSVAPHVTLGGDHNLKVIQSSSALIAFLQCEIPMPASRSPLPQPPVVTVCEKLARK
jgi:hypothetical protein